MKLISWNCKMAFRRKAESLLKYHPDLALIPECEYMGEDTPKRLWFGDNLKKGLGIFSYSDFELELHEEYNPSFKYGTCLAPLWVHENLPRTHLDQKN